MRKLKDALRLKFEAGHRFTLTGESLRKKSPAVKEAPTTNPPRSGGPPAAWQGPIRSKTIRYQIGENNRKSKPA